MALDDHTVVDVVYSGSPRKKPRASILRPILERMAADSLNKVTIEAKTPSSLSSPSLSKSCCATDCKSVNLYDFVKTVERRYDC